MALSFFFSWHSGHSTLYSSQTNSLRLRWGFGFSGRGQCLGDLNGMVMMFLFAILGFIMEKYHYAIAPVVLGLVWDLLLSPPSKR